MKHNLFSLTTILSFLVLPPCMASDEVALVGAEPGKWTMDHQAAVKLAGEKELPLILNFTGSDWCGWCQLMDKNVFAEAAWKDYAKANAVLVTIDFPRDPLKVPEAYRTNNIELQKKFGVQGYPTYVILDSDGETLLGRLAAGQEKTPESFIEEFKEATRFSSPNIKAYLAANPDKADAFKAAMADVQKINTEFEAWTKSKPEKSAENDAKMADFKSRIEAAGTKVKSFK